MPLICALHDFRRTFITDVKPSQNYYDTSPPPVVRWGSRYFVMSLAGGLPIYLERIAADAANLKQVKTRAVEYCEVWGLALPGVEPSDYETSMPNPFRPFNVGSNTGDAGVVDNLRRSLKSTMYAISDEKLAEAWSDFQGSRGTFDTEAEEIKAFAETLQYYRAE